MLSTFTLCQELCYSVNIISNPLNSKLAIITTSQVRKLRLEKLNNLPEISLLVIVGAKSLKSVVVPLRHAAIVSLAPCIVLVVQVLGEWMQTFINEWISHWTPTYKKPKNIYQHTAILNSFYILLSGWLMHLHSNLSDFAN